MTDKRFSHNGVVIIDHLKKDLIYIDGKEDLLELAEYVDKLQEENDQLKKRISDYADITAITTHILNEEKEIAEEGIVLSINRFHEVINENEQCKMMIATLLEENQSIKKHIGELYKYVKIDVDNEIEVYPKALLEGIVDILKIIGDVE